MTTLEPPAVVLELLRERERTLATDAAAIRARLEEVRDLIEALTQRRGPGRPRKPITVINMPDRVDGGAHGSEPEPDSAA
jgi:hypothetical protein